jgi:hypothetical protein
MTPTCLHGRSSWPLVTPNAHPIKLLPRQPGHRLPPERISEPRQRLCTPYPWCHPFPPGHPTPYPETYRASAKDRRLPLQDGGASTSCSLSGGWRAPSPELLIQAHSISGWREGAVGGAIPRFSPNIASTSTQHPFSGNRGSRRSRWGKCSICLLHSTDGHPDYQWPSDQLAVRASPVLRQLRCPIVAVAGCVQAACQKNDVGKATAARLGGAAGPRVLSLESVNFFFFSAD